MGRIKQTEFDREIVELLRKPHITQVKAYKKEIKKLVEKFDEIYLTTERRNLGNGIEDLFERSFRMRNKFRPTSYDLILRTWDHRPVISPLYRSFDFQAGRDINSGKKRIPPYNLDDYLEALIPRPKDRIPEVINPGESKEIFLYRIRKKV